MIEQLSRKLWAHQRVELDPTLLAVVRDLFFSHTAIWSEKRSFVTPSISSPFQWDFRGSSPGCFGHGPLHPPSVTSSTEPVTTTRRRRAGKAMAPAISSGCPMRPIGTPPATASIDSGDMVRYGAVRVGPGATAFTRMFVVSA